MSIYANFTPVAVGEIIPLLILNNKFWCYAVLGTFSASGGGGNGIEGGQLHILRAGMAYISR